MAPLYGTQLEHWNTEYGQIYVVLLNEKNWSIPLINQLKNNIGKPFCVVLSHAQFCKKVSFNSISKAGEREREDKVVTWWAREGGWLNKILAILCIPVLLTQLPNTTDILYRWAEKPISLSKFYLQSYSEVMSPLINKSGFFCHTLICKIAAVWYHTLSPSHCSQRRGGYSRGCPTPLHWSFVVCMLRKFKS